jgi:hypothetical protein
MNTTLTSQWLHEWSRSARRVSSSLDPVRPTVSVFAEVPAQRGAKRTCRGLRSEASCREVVVLEALNTGSQGRVLESQKPDHLLSGKERGLGSVDGVRWVGKEALVASVDAIADPAHDCHGSDRRQNALQREQRTQSDVAVPYGVWALTMATVNPPSPPFNPVLSWMTRIPSVNSTTVDAANSKFRS